MRIRAGPNLQQNVRLRRSSYAPWIDGDDFHAAFFAATMS